MRLLPSLVALPAAPNIDHSALLAALPGVSRAVLHIWRRDRAFPRPVRQGRTTITRTADVARWLVERGVRIDWI